MKNSDRKEKNFWIIFCLQTENVWMIFYFETDNFLILTEQAYSFEKHTDLHCFCSKKTEKSAVFRIFILNFFYLNTNC